MRELFSLSVVCITTADRFNEAGAARTLFGVLSAFEPLTRKHQLFVPYFTVRVPDTFGPRNRLLPAWESSLLLGRDAIPGCIGRCAGAFGLLRYGHRDLDCISKRAEVAIHFR